MRFNSEYEMCSKIIITILLFIDWKRQILIFFAPIPNEEINVSDYFRRIVFFY